MTSLWSRGFAFIVFVMLCQSAIPGNSFSQTAPAGFLIEDAFPTATFNLPVQVVFLPDGRKFVVEKEGRIWVVTAGGTKLSTPFIDLTAKVLSNDDRGLDGIAIDPDFATNRWVYMLYTVDPDSNGNDNNVAAFARLERYQASLVNPNVADLATRQILIGQNWALGIPEPPLDRHHMVGTLRFAPDKTLLIGSGDAANASYMDAGGTDPAGTYGAGKTNPAEDLGAFRSQTLNSMDGKILRVDKETGNGLSSNPYWDANPTSSRSRVWLYGLRNPFRFSIRPGTGSTNPAAGQPGVLYIGDVGWNTTEELDIARQGGMNFGWPCFEAPYGQPSYQAVTSTSWPNPNVICPAPLSAENPQPKTAPVLWWDHNNGANSNPPGLVGNCSIGGVFYTGTSYPSSYQNRYYHADYGRGWIKMIQVDANDNIISTSGFIDNGGGIVDLETDPVSGDLYYVNIASNTINRIRYVTGNLPPVVNASINPTSGYSPLIVTAIASGSTDPDGDALSYVWAFGDGGTAHRADTLYTYATSGVYTAIVTVTDIHGSSSLAAFQIVVGQVPPPGNILQPIAGTFFNQSQSVSLQATAADPLQGPATYRWDIDLHHNNHFHFSTETYFGQMASFIPSTPNDGEQYSLRIRLAVTQGALTALDTAEIQPRLNVTPVVLSFSPPTPGPGSSFQVLARVRSSGEVGSSISTFEVREGTTLLASGPLSPVFNGDSLVVAATIGPLALGQHTIRFVIDPANNLVETNESDNEITGVVTVAGLIASYSFDQGSGNSLTDVSGHGLTGTISGAAWTAAGKYGNALSFNGTNNYVDLGNPALLQITGSMTWSAWVNASGNPADDGQIIAKSNDITGWQFKTSPDITPHTFGIAVSAGSNSHTQRYSTTVRALNTWYHVAGVYNASAQTLDIYVNGVLNNGTLLGVVPSSQFDANFNVNIGRRSGGYYFKGIIDELRVYNRALTQTEIQTDMNTPLGSPPPPAPPVLATPANGSTGVGTSPTLTWNPSLATAYRVQVSTNPAFASTIVDQPNISTTSFVLGGLAASTTYYWRVNASNSGGTSAYSAVSSFTTVAPPAPPAPPVLLTPANGASGISSSPTLTWNASGGATSYRVQVSTSPDFSTTVVDLSHITGTSHSLTGLADNTTYYWRVSAAGSGGTGAYSASWNFSTGAPPPPPAPPLLATPISGSTGVSTSPTLTWNASTGATSYQVQVSTDSGFGATLINQGGISTTSLAPGSLALNTTYYWRVAASGAGGQGAYSAVWNFTTMAPPPPPVPPILTSPANGSTGIATNPTLTWNTSSGATSYRVQVSTDPGFATTVADQSTISTTSYSLSSLATGTIYYWHVNATNSGGTGSYSSTSSFTTVQPPPPPSPPVLATPANGATGVATNPTLTWNASIGATSYRIQVSNDSLFATTSTDQSTITTTSFALSGLSTNARYYWRVNATGTSGTGAYSAVFSFTTVAIPAGLVAAYAFDEGIGTSVADGTGHGITGTIAGASWTTGGKYGNALSFNGTSSYVDLGNPALLQLTGSMTWSAWVKATANPADDGQIIAKSDDASGWQVKTSPDTGPHTFGVAVSSSAISHTQRYCTTVRSLGTWYFVAGVYNATNQTLSMYVNGTLDNGTLSGTVPLSQVNSGVNVNIGRRAPGAYGGFYFNGVIDEVRIYNRALTQAEIQSDMNVPLGAPPPPPVPPVLATPVNGASGVATNPTLTWNASGGATSYRVQVSSDAGFATTVLDQSGIATTSVGLSGLAMNTTYYWHVNATNTGGTSVYSSTSNFTTVVPPPPPPAPVLTTPADGTTGVAINPTLTWNASTGASSYRIQVSTSPGFGTTVIDQSNIAITSYAASALSTSTTYYWHVNGTNSSGTSSYSTSSSFTTTAQTGPPVAPVLVSPANGATGVTTNPTLTWNASAGATSYRLQVSTSSTFATTVVDQSSIVTTSYGIGGLLLGTTYYWRVNASNGGGASAYSSASTFATFLPTGLVAGYAFDAGTGTTAVDASGHGITGTISGATWTTQGKYGSALSFDGTSSYVDLGNPAALQLTGSATWSAWIRATANPADDGQIIAKANDVSGWQFKTSPDTGPHTFGVAVAGSTSTHTQRYSTTIRALNTWYHVAAVYNATARTLNLYVNGVLDNGVLLGTVPSSQVNLTINANIGRRPAGYYFNGTIDEVRIYNRALTQSEIQSDMNTPLSSPAAQPTIISFKAEIKDSTILVISADEERKVSVQPIVQIVQGEGIGSAARGSTAVFSVSAIGEGELSYQWQRDGMDIPGEHTPSYTLTMRSSAEATRIRCVVSNSSGTATTGEAIVSRGSSGISLPAQSCALPVSMTANLAPTQYTLEQNYPNPFNPTTTFNYAIPKESYVTLQLFNLLGEVSATLDDQLRAPGYYTLTFDARNLASGVYMYRIRAGEFVMSRKLLLLR